MSQKKEENYVSETNEQQQAKFSLVIRRDGVQY